MVCKVQLLKGGGWKGHSLNKLLFSLNAYQFQQVFVETEEKVLKFEREIEKRINAKHVQMQLGFLSPETC